VDHSGRCLRGDAWDNLGFAIGFYGGRRLLERYQKTLHIRPDVIARGEELFARYGAATIFVARFIAGMRIIAGPLAGVLRMSCASFCCFISWAPCFG